DYTQFTSYYTYLNHLYPHSFPTRRSSDLRPPRGVELLHEPEEPVQRRLQEAVGGLREGQEAAQRRQAADQRPDGSHLHRHPHVRSEEHTSELQSRENLVCRLLLEKKNKNS